MAPEEAERVRGALFIYTEAHFEEDVADLRQGGHSAELIEAEKSRYRAWCAPIGITFPDGTIGEPWWHRYFRDRRTAFLVPHDLGADVRDAWRRETQEELSEAEEQRLLRYGMGISAASPAAPRIGGALPVSRRLGEYGVIRC